MAKAPVNRLTLFEDERVSLWYYPEKKIIHHQFRAFVHGDVFREVMMQALEAFEKNGATKWLSDDRGYQTVPPEDVAWSAAEWVPRVMASGWKHWAIVLSKQISVQMGLRPFIKICAENGIAVCGFTDPDAAMAWLESR